jgi:NAD(P)-dependent dehydrogenase (short-subunit alcohol dehydrogenase family)
LKRQGKGIIHNMSSGVGITGFPGIYGYASTKGAIESLTRTLALEFATYGVCINLMHPPLTNTKSASPLGVPVQAMDDPARVGRNLAKQVLSTKPVIAADFRTAVYLFCAYRYPKMLGELFAKLTENARNPQA